MQEILEDMINSIESWLNLHLNLEYNNSNFDDNEEIGECIESAIVELLYQFFDIGRGEAYEWGNIFAGLSLVPAKHYYSEIIRVAIDQLELLQEIVKANNCHEFIAAWLMLSQAVHVGGETLEYCDNSNCISDLRDIGFIPYFLENDYFENESDLLDNLSEIYPDLQGRCEEIVSQYDVLLRKLNNENNR